MVAEQVLQRAHGGACRGLHLDVAFDDVGGGGSERGFARIGGGGEQALGDLGQRAGAQQRQAGLFQVIFDLRQGGVRLVRIETIEHLRLQGRRPQRLCRSQAVELGAKGLGSPKLMLQTAAPALRHRQSAEQRAKQPKVAEPEPKAVDTGLAHGLNDQG